MDRVSVIICTYRPREDYLQRVLSGLRQQTLDLENWELLLIDNASPEVLSETWDLSWHPHGRHIREDSPGLTMARQRGIREAIHPLLVFVDDDNVLDSKYLETAARLAQMWPHVGAFGGSQLPEYEEEPTQTIRRNMPMLAVRTVEKVLWTNIKGIDEATPRGAGLCLRRRLGVGYARKIEEDSLRKLLDRSSSGGLLSGGDTDMVWSACDEGFGMLVTPELKLTHLINKRRLAKAYLLRLAEGHATSGVILANIHHLPQSTSFLIDSAREGLRILQAPTLFDKQLGLANFRGRRKASRMIEEAGKI